MIKKPKRKEVDAIADKHFRLKNEASAIDEQQAALKKGISELCDQFGVVEGKQSCLLGDRFKVAIITPEPSPVFDEAAFLESLTPAQRKLVTKRVLSPEKLKQAIADKLISRKALKPFVVMKNNTPRLFVGPLKDEASDQHHG